MQKTLADYNFEEEVAEEVMAANFGGYMLTGFPQPSRRFRLVYESQQANVEHTYFWVYNHLKTDFGFGDIIKTMDTFGASENSSFWGITETRKSIQQDKASGYLRTIAQLVKDMFTIVREIRLLRERLLLYNKAETSKSADDGLKNLWVDLVDGQGRGPNSGMNIYAMANQLGFSTLPDLFFKAHVKKLDDLDKVVGQMADGFNEKVKEVLSRKLANYIAWRVESHKEMVVKEKFNLKYLRQHYQTIKMYISWVKPYLRNVQKLQSPEKYDRNPEIISAFEGAVMEIEFLARKHDKAHDEDGKLDPKKPLPTVLATFVYRVKPNIQYAGQQERAPLHYGRVEFTLRCYGWTQEDAAQYIKYREQETLELIGMVDASLRDSLDAMGEELLQYLRDAGETDSLPELKKAEEKKKDEAPKMNLFEPFTALFKGLGDMATMPFEGLIPKKEEKPKMRGNPKAAKDALAGAFNAYKNYKKAHGMVSW
jgi:hypothetical protein